MNFDSLLACGNLSVNSANCVRRRILVRFPSLRGTMRLCHFPWKYGGVLRHVTPVVAGLVDPFLRRSSDERSELH
jgi:hypothetical protein